MTVPGELVQNACSKTHRKTADWFSPLDDSRMNALNAKSSIAAMELPSFPPLGPLAEDLYVFKDMMPWEDS